MKLKFAEKGKLVITAYLTAARNWKKGALVAFENFSPSNKRDYVDLVTEAKTYAARCSQLKTESKVSALRYVPSKISCVSGSSKAVTEFNIKIVERQVSEGKARK